MQMSKIVIGAMRFKDRAGAVATVRNAIDCGFNYIDCSPCYCYQSEEENSESWVGEAISHPDYRDRIMVSSKCTVGNGGWGFDDFDQPKGFGARSKEQLNAMFDQSLKRIDVSRFDYYHLWTTHTMDQLNEALKPGGWHEGVMERKNQWDHLGITTHADNETMIKFLETGLFETITMPLNVINTTRMPTLEYCREKGIQVIAMNPLAGGFLANDERLLELALRYLISLDNVHPLIGFSSPEEVDYAKQILDTTPEDGGDSEALLKEVSCIINATEPRCTACGYCMPCPEGINVGASLSYYNLYKYMGMESAKEAFNGKQWEDGLRLDKCLACGECESRCPNHLNVLDIIEDAKKILYAKNV